jgi:hypothetical protein
MGLLKSSAMAYGTISLISLVIGADMVFFTSQVLLGIVVVAMFLITELKG